MSADDFKLYLPDSYVQDQYAWLRENGLAHLIPTQDLKYVHVLRSPQDVADFDQHRGRAAKPEKTMVLYVRGTPVFIPTAGVTEVAELQDVAYHVFEKADAKAKRGEPQVDSARIRERMGYPQADQFDPLFRQAVEDRMAAHRRNSRTDPAPVIDEPKGNVHGWRG